MTEKDVKINETKKELEMYKESTRQLKFVLLSYARKLNFNVNSGVEGNLADAKKLLIKVLGENDLLNDIDSKVAPCESCPLSEICETLIGLGYGDDE